MILTLWSFCLPYLAYSQGMFKELNSWKDKVDQQLLGISNTLSNLQPNGSTSFSPAQENWEHILKTSNLEDFTTNGFDQWDDLIDGLPEAVRPETYALPTNPCKSSLQDQSLISLQDQSLVSLQDQSLVNVDMQMTERLEQLFVCFGPRVRVWCLLLSNILFLYLAAWLEVNPEAPVRKKLKWLRVLRLLQVQNQILTTQQSRLRWVSQTY